MQPSPNTSQSQSDFEHQGNTQDQRIRLLHLHCLRARVCSCPELYCKFLQDGFPQTLSFSRRTRHLLSNLSSG
jgi:hypothetical protein